MNILVTGSSGFIGRALVSKLGDKGHNLIPLRRGVRTRGESAPTWNPQAGQIDLEPAEQLDAVVHLAGENIAQRWTRSAKARIRTSRVDATHQLVAALMRLPRLPRVLVCASATGYYGDRGGEFLDEYSVAGEGFLPEVCQAWELAADVARQGGIRVVHLRFGIILGRGGGALAKMLPVFRLGLGGKLGEGSQYWSWIALEDLLRVVEMALQDERLEGPLNVVSPRPVTNAEFTTALAQALHRPAVFSVPALAVKLLFGEMGREALLASARVRPARLAESGFEFQLPRLEGAFKHLLTHLR